MLVVMVDGRRWLGKSLELNRVLREVAIAADERGFVCGCRYSGRAGWIPCPRPLHRAFAARGLEDESVRRYLELRTTLRLVRNRLRAAGFGTRTTLDDEGGLRLTIEGRSTPALELCNAGPAEQPQLLLRTVRRGPAA